MIEIQDRAVKASQVRTGDRLTLSGRLVTQVQVGDDHVTLSHGQNARTIVEAGSLVRIRRRVRVEAPEQAPSVDESHVWLVEAQRPSQGRYGRSA